MSNNTRSSNSNSNNNSNWYTTLADEDEEERGSLHTILDDSITTVQAIAEEAKEQQLERELELFEGEERRGLKLLDTTINQVNLAFRTFIGKHEDGLDSKTTI